MQGNPYWPLNGPSFFSALKFVGCFLSRCPKSGVGFTSNLAARMASRRPSLSWKREFIWINGASNLSPTRTQNRSANPYETASNFGIQVPSDHSDLHAANTMALVRFPCTSGFHNLTWLGSLRNGHINGNLKLSPPSWPWSKEQTCKQLRQTIKVLLCTTPLS